MTKPKTKITTTQLADMMESLHKFTLQELIDALDGRYDTNVNSSSMRCRLARLCRQVDPETGDNFLNKMQAGQCLMYIFTPLQADSLRHGEKLKIARANARRSKAALKDDAYTVWGTPLKGKPGTTVLMRGEF